MRLPRRAGPPAHLALVLLGLLAAPAGGGCGREPATSREIREVEKAWQDLRDAIVRGDDEAFFLMHCRRAREGAVAEFPLIRSRYLASPEGEREAFRALYHVTDEEFRNAEPRELVVKMVPWKSGWRERAPYYRQALVKDVRFLLATRPDGTTEREAQVILDISAAIAPEDRARIPENYMPAVVLVKDPEGWRRRAFFTP